MSNQNSQNKLFVLVGCILAVTVMQVAADGPITIVKNLIQGNLAGIPIIHEITVWDFDPEVAVKRRELFERANGFRGERLIERMGLGIDGLHDIRLAQQQARDEGLLGGTIHHIKSGLNTLD